MEKDELFPGLNLRTFNIFSNNIWLSIEKYVYSIERFQKGIKIDRYHPIHKLNEGLRNEYKQNNQIELGCRI